MRPMLNRRFYQGMRIFSALFNPFQAPFLAFFVLFFFTYLTILPLFYRLFVLTIVYIFTIALPTFGFYLYRRLMGWRLGAYRDRKKRLIPYFIVLLCYLACYLLMTRLNLPRYMYGIIMGTAIATTVSAIANFRWKIAEHMIPMGGTVAGLIIFSFLLNYNPLILLSLSILASGALGSARIILKHHTAGEVLGGFLIGFFSILLTLGYYFW